MIRYALTAVVLILIWIWSQALLVYPVSSGSILIAALVSLPLVGLILLLLGFPVETERRVY